MLEGDCFFFVPLFAVWVDDGVKEEEEEERVGGVVDIIRVRAAGGGLGWGGDCSCSEKTIRAESACRFFNTPPKDTYLVDTTDVEGRDSDCVSEERDRIDAIVDNQTFFLFFLNGAFFGEKQSHHHRDH